MMNIEPSGAQSAASIQRTIDETVKSSERVRIVLPAGTVVLDRGIESRSGVTLVGRGRKTALVAPEDERYPLSGFAVYGVYDVPLTNAGALAAGMTVCIRDNVHRDFFETFGLATWVDGNWIGLDTALESDYLADNETLLLTSYPLVFARNARDVGLESLILYGGGKHQTEAIGSCRGAALSFIRCSRVAVSDVEASDFPGEGLGFQLCKHLSVESCTFNDNREDDIDEVGRTVDIAADERVQGLFLSGNRFTNCIRDWTGPPAALDREETIPVGFRTSERRHYRHLKGVGSTSGGEEQRRIL